MLFLKLCLCFSGNIQTENPFIILKSGERYSKIVISSRIHFNSASNGLSQIYLLLVNYYRLFQSTVSLKNAFNCGTNIIIPRYIIYTQSVTSPCHLHTSHTEDNLWKV